MCQEILKTEQRIDVRYFYFKGVKENNIKKEYRNTFRNKENKNKTQ